MNHPFNQPRDSRWSELNSRRPENTPFAEWAEQQLYTSHNEQWARFEAADVVEGCEQLLRGAPAVGPEAERQARQHRARAEGWTAGEPGE